ncbi:uncharacterized protein [Dysidea avara]|uniref:uncharacterized protein isoform X2 n=1 Tax=Dysidea avara TaxID=196820 RepID=UPI00332C12BF
MKMSTAQIIFQLLWLLGLTSCSIAQESATLSLTHSIAISGNDVTVTFVANCPANFSCEIDGGGYVPCTSPKTYNNLTPGTHTVNIQALAIKLDRLLQPVIATRTFTIQEAVTTQTLIVDAQLKQSGTSLIATFSANLPAMFECAVGDNSFTPCTSPHDFGQLGPGTHRIQIKATSKTTPPLISTRTFTVTVAETTGNLRVEGHHQLSACKRVALFFNASQEASFRCRLIKEAPPPISTTRWVPCTSGRMYRNVNPGIYKAEVEATSTSNPSDKVALNIREIVVPNIDQNCSKCGPGKYQGRASVAVEAPNAIVNIKLNKPSFIMCSLNNGPQESCRDKFKYSNLAVGSYNLVITTVAACFPYDDLVYETNFTIGVPVDGGWGSWIFLECTATGSCGLGTRTRVRGCDNPAPQNGGKPCPGRSFKTKTCGTPCKNEIVTFSVTGQYQISGSDVQVFFNTTLPAMFTCKLDRNPSVSCVSGHVFEDVDVGRHKIQVTARLDSNRRTKQVLKLGPFMVKSPPPTHPPPPPPPRVTANGQIVNVCDLQLSFSANVSATFRCRINGGPWVTCFSGYIASGLQSGINTIEIEATDVDHPEVKTVASTTIDLTGRDCPLAITFPVCSPTVDANNFTFCFQANKPNVQYTCELNGKRPKPCNEGCVTYPNLRKTAHVVTVSAMAGGESIDNTINFESKFSSRRCQIYTCIDGVIVNGTAANIHFTCDDPGATFKCRLNGKTLTPCVSPLQLSDLPQGGNIVDITPVCERTASGKRESITFTV